MARKRKRRKLPGCYCWSCDCRRPNEKFSGKGRGRHLCRDCAKLGRAELAYRQAQRDLERCVSPSGRVYRKRRKQFAALIEHEDPRIRALAAEYQHPFSAVLEPFWLPYGAPDLWLQPCDLDAAFWVGPEELPPEFGEDWSPAERGLADAVDANPVESLEMERSSR